jgi:uncharacterized membrane protein AbrB (regulator of aidB expression)
VFYWRCAFHVAVAAALQLPLAAWSPLAFMWGPNAAAAAVCCRAGLRELEMVRAPLIPVLQAEEDIR